MIDTHTHTHMQAHTHTHTHTHTDTDNAHKDITTSHCLLRICPAPRFAASWAYGTHTHTHTHTARKALHINTRTHRRMRVDTWSRQCVPDALLML